jgi:hypothetical protein
MEEGEGGGGGRGAEAEDAKRKEKTKRMNDSAVGRMLIQVALQQIFAAASLRSNHRP